MEKQRSSFTGKIGFVLAAAGSAVGLGNLWRFPYLAAKHGGGIFLLVYLVLAFTFGFALMLTEVSIGRKTGLSAIGAFKKLDKRFSFIGYLAALVPIIILPYYSVIGGWVIKYFGMFISGNMEATADPSYFSYFIGKEWQPLICFLIFIGLTTLIVLFGVQNGVEKVSKLMMPALAVLSVVIAVYVVCQPGAWEGVLYYIKPDFSKFSLTTVVAAMGQLFYSMSLAMGIMITYGSYMKPSVHLEKSVHQIEYFDTGIAFIAGLMIIPAVIMQEGEAGLGKGPGLMFSTLPRVFSEMPGGNVIGTAFFLLVLFAALTSSISLMETIVSILQDKFGWKRTPSCIVVFILCVLLGCLSCFGFSIWSEVKIVGLQLLDFFDFISNSLLMPIVALLTCIFVGYFLKPQKLIAEVEKNGAFKAKKLFVVMIKYIAPICLVVICIFSILEVFNFIEV